MTAPSPTDRAFGVVEPLGLGKVRASGWDSERHVVEEVFRFHHDVIQIGIRGEGGGRAFRDVTPTEWATFPQWLRLEIPRALGVPGAP